MLHEPRRSGRLRAIELRSRPLSQIGLQSFPYEVLLYILSHLPPAALCAVECTCRHFATRVPWRGDDVAHSHSTARTNASGTSMLTLSERAAQRLTRGALPLRDESYKELLCWGAPLSSWDDTTRHPQLHIPTRGVSVGADADTTKHAALPSTPLAICTGQAPVEQGIFPAAVTLPFSGDMGVHRVRIRLDGDPLAISPCAVGVCPGDFPAARVSCPSQWYDLCKSNQRAL